MRQSACRPQRSQVSGYVARVDVGASGQKVQGKFFDVLLPRGKLLRSEGLSYQVCVSSKIGAQSRFGVANFSREFRFARADLGEDEAADFVSVARESEVGVKRNCTSSGRGRSQEFGVGSPDL